MHKLWSGRSRKHCKEEIERLKGKVQKELSRHRDAMGQVGEEAQGEADKLDAMIKKVEDKLVKSKRSNNPIHSRLKNCKILEMPEPQLISTFLYTK